MKTFREFLQEKAQEPRQDERRERREEWVAAVARLIAQIHDWLKDADPGGLLDISKMDVEKLEEGLGAYKVEGLSIGLNDTTVRIIPVGRNVVGIIGPSGSVGGRAEGRIDITNGTKKYILYRSLTDGSDRWFALDHRFEPSELDREKFEAIMQDLLS